MIETIINVNIITAEISYVLNAYQSKHACLYSNDNTYFIAHSCKMSCGYIIISYMTFWRKLYFPSCMSSCHFYMIKWNYFERYVTKKARNTFLKANWIVMYRGIIYVILRQELWMSTNYSLCVNSTAGFICSLGVYEVTVRWNLHHLNNLWFWS